jgi:hypothetical protein
MSFFDKVKSGAGKVAFEADKVADAKKVEMDIGGLRKQINEIYTTLGEMSYRRYVATNQETPEFLEVCQRILAVDQKITLKQEELKQINARIWQAPQQQQQSQASPPPPPQQGSKFCPSCGTSVSETTKFCSNCGAKVA